MSVLTNAHGTFGMVLDSFKSVDGHQMAPGTILVKGIKSYTINAIIPDVKSPVYFSALILWAHFSGNECMKYADDKRLPDFVRKSIAGFTAMFEATHDAQVL